MVDHSQRDFADEREQARAWFEDMFVKPKVPIDSLPLVPETIKDGDKDETRQMD
mgnify:CR=1 FL=1